MIGPALTVLATGVHEYFIRRGDLPPTVALLMVFVPIAGFLGGSAKRSWDGLWAALLSAAWLSGYSVYLDPGSIERVMVVPAANLISAVIVGVLRARAWREEAMKRAAGDLALDQNLARLEQVELLARDLYWKWDEIDDYERRKQAKTLWDRTNNIAALAEGWRAIGRHKYWAFYGEKSQKNDPPTAAAWPGRLSPGHRGLKLRGHDPRRGIDTGPQGGRSQ